MTGEVRLNGGKYGQMGFRKQEIREIRSSGGGGNDPVHSTVARWYDFREPRGYLGNVGLEFRPTFTKCLGRSNVGQLQLRALPGQIDNLA